MSGKHTPGPWRLAKWPHEQECMGAEIKGTFAIIGASGISPAVVWGGLPECEANARLIAAAPDLLEAGRALAKAMRMQDEFDTGPLEAAITKAEMGSSNG